MKLRRNLPLALASAVCLTAIVSAGDASAQTAVNGKIVYVGSDGVHFDIFTMNGDGSDVSRLTEDGFNYDPKWSPDGSSILFVNYREFGTGNVYVMGAAGQSPTRLTDTTFHEGGNYDAAWAPDGNSIVFVSTRDGGGAELYRMASNGSDPVRLTTTVDEVDDREPAVAPDGRIAFVSDRANTRDEFYDLFVLNAAGTEVTRLTFDSIPDANHFGHTARNPAWSPDGTRIAFDSTRSGNLEVWVINADGTGLTNVSNHASQDYEPAWAPDGTQLTFISTRAGDYDIWLVDAPPAPPAARTNMMMAAATAASPPRNLTKRTSKNAQTPDIKKIVNTAPTIINLRPARGATVSSRRPIIAANVGDKQTNLFKSNILLLVDAVEIDKTRYTYDRPTNRLRFEPETEMSLGEHTVRIVATDPQGRQKEKSWKFTIEAPAP